MEVFVKNPIVFPTSLDIPLIGDGVSSATVQVSSIGRAASVSAGLQFDVPDLIDAKVTELSVLRLHTIVLDNPDPLPPGFPPLPPQTEQVLIVVAQSDGSPLDVGPGEFLTVKIAAQMKDPAFTQAGATLVISGDAWGRLFVPVMLRNGSGIEPAFGSTDIVARQAAFDVSYEHR